MLSYRHYIPILKGKQGEFRALSHLSTSIKSILTPFFDIPRPDGSSRKPMDIDTYLQKKVASIYDCCGYGMECFVDYTDFNLSLRTTLGEHYVKFSFDHFRNCNVQAIPVTGLDRDDDYNAAIAHIIRIDKRGVAVRLLKEDIENPALTKANMDDLVKRLNVIEQDIHLVLDFRNVDENEVVEKREDAINFLSNFGNLKVWKTIFLAASGFPQHMGGVQKYSAEMIPRIELDLWEQVLAEGKKKINRLPAFADYGICHPDILDFDITMTPSANIRYTLERDWMIVKGAGLKRKIDGRTVYNYEQFYKLADFLASNTNYCGSHFSHGDSYIHDCSLRKGGPGNLPKWREAGTNHHITFVAGQIANSHVI